MSRAIGILGGMGPAATVDLMARIIAATPAGGDAGHLRLLVDSNPAVPDRNRAIAGEGPSPGPPLAAMARGLEAQGADMLAIACNSAHAWAGEIRAATSIPLVSMIDATAEAIGRDHPGLRRVGLLAADACLGAGLYQEPLGRAGYEVLTSGDQPGFMALIYGVKAGETGTAAQAGMAAQAEALAARGAELIVAACTEVPLLLRPEQSPVPLVDSTAVLVAKLVHLAAD
ncbi:aspartate/glutamate racemase family protein [Sphingomonas sp. PR090111-T3T-6A]|uniref:aspartate/glutamate racemase family protein n=1 Tax=Sphingomonas sp. PR090111-T3T-6A TaxID=685778 RepID=UPI000374320E|nr:amino acid racemase [Sphingomonas sp. PR090111-T3T-6A]